jgi:hypothetical protein
MYIRSIIAEMYLMNRVIVLKNRSQHQREGYTSVFPILVVKHNDTIEALCRTIALQSYCSRLGQPPAVALVLPSAALPDSSSLLERR